MSLSNGLHLGVGGVLRLDEKGTLRNSRHWRRLGQCKQRLSDARVIRAKGSKGGLCDPEVVRLDT
eukprot:896586-Amorphochlora_amoeboformis.AAC.1